MAGLRKAKDAQVAARRTRAIELRAAGKSLDEIIEAVPGYNSRGAVSQDISRALRQRIEEQGAAADELRELELERLDLLYRKAWEVLERPHPALSGGRVVKVSAPDGREVTLRDDGPTLAALDRLLKISESRRKLLGLDSPVQVDGGITVRYEVAGVNLSDLT